MRNLFTLFGKELRHFLLSPIAYVAAATFAFITGFYFWLIFKYFETQGQPISPWQVFLGGPSMLYFMFMIIIIPALTMRLLAEEKRSGTLELLMTSPVTAFEVVVSKYLAAMTVFFIMLTPTLLHVLLIWIYAAEDAAFPWKPIVAYYGGLGLLGGMFCSFGLVTTAISRDQVTAYILAFGLLFFLWLLPLFNYVIPADWESVRKGIEYADLMAKLKQFAQGIVDSRNLLLPVTVSILNIFVAIQVVDSRKWR